MSSGSPPGPGSRGRSQHSVDQLIRELIQTGRAATAAEIGEILDRMATAAFNPDLRAVPTRDRGHSYQGQTLGTRADSLTYHLIKRVVIEEQWAHGTTASDYVGHLHAAARAAARLCAYSYGAGAIAATLSPTSQVVPAARLGPRLQALVLVIYSANLGRLVTGYQVSSVQATSIPTGALWLR